MQTLGLADSTPRSEGRLKSLFWPSIRNTVDLDSVTTQGFWLCVLVGVFSFFVSCFIGNGLIIGLTSVEALFFFLGGVGVRMESRAAAIIMFTTYLLSGFLLQKMTGNGFGIPRIIILALLLANVRGIWISRAWSQEQTEVVPVRLSETWLDKLSDQWPPLLWPKLRIVFYVLATLEIGVQILGLIPFHAGSPEGSNLG